MTFKIRGLFVVLRTVDPIVVFFIGTVTFKIRALFVVLITFDPIVVLPMSRTHKRINLREFICDFWRIIRIII